MKRRPALVVASGSLVAFLLFATLVPAIPIDEVWYEQLEFTVTTTTSVTKQYPFSYSFLFGPPFVLVGYDSRWLDEVCLGSGPIDWQRFAPEGVFGVGGRVYQAYDSVARTVLATMIASGLSIMPLPINEKNITVIPPGRMTYALTFTCTLRSRVATETFVLTQTWESDRIEVLLAFKPCKYLPKNRFIIGEVDLTVETGFAMTPIFYTFTRTLVEPAWRTERRTRTVHITLIQYILRLLHGPA